VADSVRCSGCGRFRPAWLEGRAERPPCPHCGATALTLAVSVQMTVTTAFSVRSSLQPGDQGQDWRRRWDDIQIEAAELFVPLTMGMSGPSIQAARRRVQSFYVEAYHLKDDLKVAASVTGITGAIVEAAVSGNADLALLCDLSNLVKHRSLNRTPRSGHIPRFVRWAGTDLPGTPSPGWRLDLVIEHNGVTFDGLDFVQRAVDAWRQVLVQWGLI
jgi:hypothetical protein